MQPRETQEPIPEDLQITVKRLQKQVEQALVLPANLQLHEGTPGNFGDCDQTICSCCLEHYRHAIVLEMQLCIMSIKHLVVSALLLCNIMVLFYVKSQTALATLQ